MDILNSIIAEATAYFWDMNSRLALFYLAFTVILAYVIWRVRGRPETFVTWLLPAAVYCHKSNLVDIKIFLFNSALSIVGLFATLAFGPIITASLLDFFAGLSSEPYVPHAFTWGRSAIATVIMILTLDFCKYWAHYIHHEARVLWPFHAVHHSAEVLTPLTANRNHPMFLLIRTAIYSVIVGAVQALMLWLLLGKIDIITIGTANAGYVIFNAAGANLRHSHIWLSYGPRWEHIFISPAQHHIHHSSAKKHFNKNYGEVLAIWDWMFGTLYVTDGHEALTFGVADGDGNLIEQPHPTLRAAILHPFVESWEAFRGPKVDPAPKVEPQ